MPKTPKTLPGKSPIANGMDKLFDELGIGDNDNPLPRLQEDGS